MNKKYIIFAAVLFLLPMVVTIIGFASTGNYQVIPQVIGSAVIFGVIIFLFLRYFKKMLQPVDIPNGIPATARVISCRQGNLKLTSGVNTNYQLIIDVMVIAQNGETWPATLKQMVNITQVGIFQPGVTFAIKYDPNDRTKICIDQSAQQSGYSSMNTQQFGFNQDQQTPFGSVNIPGFGTVDSMMAKQSLMHQPEDIVLRLTASSSLLNELNANGNGVSVQATILSKALLINNIMNGADAYQLRVKLNTLEGNTIETDLTILIQKPSEYKIEPGKTVYVKYDRNNPYRVVMTGTDKPDSVVAL